MPTVGQSRESVEKGSLTPHYLRQEGIIGHQLTHLHVMHQCSLCCVAPVLLVLCRMTNRCTQDEQQGIGVSQHVLPSTPLQNVTTKCRLCRQYTTLT